MRPIKGGGVVVETASETEKKKLADSPGLAESGLRLEEPKKFDPRVILYDVPNRITDENLLKSMYEKNVSMVIGWNEYVKRVRVVKRMNQEGQTVSNIIIELPAVCRNKLLTDGRVYAEWMSFKVCIWERVSRCFKCLGYGHMAKDCKSEKLCWRCGRAGHLAKVCRDREDCVNCRIRKRHSGHSAVSPACPEFEWRLKLLRARMDNG